MGGVGAETGGAAAETDGAAAKSGGAAAESDGVAAESGDAMQVCHAGAAGARCLVGAVGVMGSYSIPAVVISTVFSLG